MFEEHITFNGKEAAPISSSMMADAIKLLGNRNPDDVATLLHHIVENCSADQLERIFGPVLEGDGISVMSGIPVHKRSWVPLGEMWMMDRGGHLLKRFKLS